MRKILFLDFDGVLHPTHFKQGCEFSRLQLLEVLFLSSFCEIVISSSWRFHYSINELKQKLGNTVGNLVIGTTGEAHQSIYARYEEISEWLSFHKACDWRAVDDSRFEFPIQCQNLILCDSRTGIDHPEIARLSDWLRS